MNEADVYIGIGSNLENPIAQSRNARVQLDALPLTRVMAMSSLYGSEPMGPSEQPPYVNAVALLKTRLEPIELLDHTQSIEDRAGRDRRTERWGARTLDLDILLFAERIITEDRLVVPHIGITDRSFVLLPLLEISPALIIPGKGPAVDFLATAEHSGASKLEVNEHET